MTRVLSTSWITVDCIHVTQPVHSGHRTKYKQLLAHLQQANPFRRNSVNMPSPRISDTPRRSDMAFSSQHMQTDMSQDFRFQAHPMNRPVTTSMGGPSDAYQQHMDMAAPYQFTAGAQPIMGNSGELLEVYRTNSAPSMGKRLST